MVTYVGSVDITWSWGFAITEVLNYYKFTKKKVRKSNKNTVVRLG